MLGINEIREQASIFRGLLENSDKKKTKPVIEDFPIMSCKLSSMLLSYHFLQLWPELEVRGISAATGKNGQITHYWLEIDDVAIDITGDQYNLICNKDLNKAIIKKRPFEAVHVSYMSESYLYNLFNIKEREPLTYGFPTIGEDFIENMEIEYNQLRNQAACT